MILLDKPYVSELLINTIIQSKYKIVGTAIAREIASGLEDNILDNQNAVEHYNSKPLIYSNSENSINWINKFLVDTKLPEQISLFKNKAKFREVLKELYPEFKFQKYQLNELLQLNAEEIEFPAIIKPAVGFFSMGIYIVENANEFRDAIVKLEIELNVIKDLYPTEVMDSSEFLIEEIIPGNEYAVDTYFDANGNPVILNIYEHVFSSGKDVADRIYFTSEKVFSETYDKFLSELQGIGKKTNISNFPMHIEFRITPQGQVIPIESNPLRFAGWCMADMSYYAWGINPYEYFFEGKVPNWNEILKDRKGKQYNVIIADIPREISLDSIEGINYQKFENDFENLLHIHRTDYSTYPVFAFAFSETNIYNDDEINKFLYSDLREYIIIS